MNQAPTIQLQTDYVSIVDEIVQYLESVKLRCEDQLGLDEQSYQKLRSSFIEKMEQLCDRFELLACEIPSIDIEAHKAYFRRYVHPFIMTSKIVERIYNKPLGYPGDYEMINMLMGEVEVPTNSLFQRLIDESHKMARAACAHKNRITMMNQRLVDQAERVVKLERMFSVLCIGCGPAIELQKFILNNVLANNCFIHVIDFNQDSIDNIQWTLANLSKELWQSRNDNYARIFALGYDSYKLMNTLPLIRKSPYIRHYGQTGILQLNADGVLNRTLLWGQYTRGKVVEVEVN